MDDNPSDLVGKEFIFEYGVDRILPPSEKTGGVFATEQRAYRRERVVRCRDCAHWQKDPTADNMGVCWFFYHEHEGQDCYAARRADIGACEEFMPRAKALDERERGE